MAAKTITRITLFKVAEQVGREQLLEYYKKMPTKAVKDGKPYILSVQAGSVSDTQRSQGYSLAVVSRFASLADMEYYDNGCAAHAELKTFARTVVQPPALIAFFENVVE